MTNTNGAESIFGAIPGSSGISGSAKGETENSWWKVVEDAFEYAYDTFPDADLGWVPDAEQAAQIRRAVVVPVVDAQNIARYGKRKGIPSTYEVKRIQGWFEKWVHYYPFVDEVAVKRAVDFHRDAWDRLTVREHREVIRKLAAMWDPWEDGNSVRRMHPTGGTHSIVGSSPRATRWHDYTREERKVLYDLVQTHRSRHRGE